MCEAPKCEEKSLFKIQSICLSALVIFVPLLRAEFPSYNSHILLPLCIIKGSRNCEAVLVDCFNEMSMNKLIILTSFPIMTIFFFSFMARNVSLFVNVMQFFSRFPEISSTVLELILQCSDRLYRFFVSTFS
jgi:hypothetical protein